MQKANYAKKGSLGIKRAQWGRKWTQKGPVKNARLTFMSWAKIAGKEVSGKHIVPGKNDAGLVCGYRAKGFLPKWWSTIVHT